MFESMLKAVAPSRLLGIRIAVIGLLAVMLSSIVIVINKSIFGAIPAVTIAAAATLYSGFLLAFVGIFVHFYKAIKGGAGSK